MDPALLALARATKGFMPEEEGLALYEAGRQAAASGLGPLLEVGTYCGKSAIFLGAAAREGGTVLFAVDHHRGSEENQAGWEHHDPQVVDDRSGRIDTLPFFRETLRQARLEEVVVGVVGHSSAVSSHWGTPLSLVFLDGAHGAVPAWADYRGWAPHLAPGGLLAIHDVFPNPADGGRPPYEIWRRALGSGAFEEAESLAVTGSLRVLRRVGSGPGPESV